MYKILYLTQFSEIGGGETILLSLLENLNRHQFKPVVILPKKGQFSERLKKLKVETHFLYLPPYLVRTFFVPGISPKAVLKFNKLVHKINPDLIHLNHLTLAIYSGIGAKSLKIPVVATAHGPWDSYYLYQDFVTNFLVNKILVPTQEMKKTITKRGIVSSKKVEIIPFGIDINKFKPVTSHQSQVFRKAFGFSPEDFVITIVGRLDPAKDHLTFLKAAQIISKKIKNARFFIVGSQKGDFSEKGNSYQAKIKNFLKSNPQLSSKVIFGGFKSDMPAVYSATDVLVSTSKTESFGLAILEAMSCAVPTVAAKGLSKLFPKNKYSLLAKEGDYEQFAQKILTLKKNSTMRKKLGDEGRKLATENFRIENYVRKIESLYENLWFLSKNHRGSKLQNFR